MDLTFSDEQAMMADMLRRYLRENYDFETRRGRLKSGARDAALWDALANRLGVLAAAIPEEHGGLGGGAVETMIVMEALGGALVFEPYLETIVMAGGLLRRLPGARADALLASIAAGEALAAPALWEAEGRHEVALVQTRAEREAAGWRLDGRKSVVVGAPDADMLIVSARSAGEARDPDGISLFLLDPATAGLSQHRFRLIDERPAADLILDGVLLPDDALLGVAGAAWPIVEQVMDEAVAALCAEAAGIMRRMLDDTIDYTSQRQQFGQPLAAFQVLQHRMVDMYMAVEMAVSASYLATLKLAEPRKERVKAVAAAKAVVADSIRFVAQNAVQLHGAMGMTEELAVGHYFKRATVLEHQFGGVGEQLARYAGISRN